MVTALEVNALNAGDTLLNSSELRTRLVKLVKANTASKLVFTDLAGRARDREAFDPRRLRKDLRDAGRRFSDEDFAATFETMEQLELGMIERGPQGGIVYWTWASVGGKPISGKAVGRMALGQDEEETSLVVSSEARYAPPGATPEQQPQANTNGAALSLIVNMPMPTGRESRLAVSVLSKDLTPLEHRYVLDTVSELLKKLEKPRG